MSNKVKNSLIFDPGRAEDLIQLISFLPSTVDYIIYNWACIWQLIKNMVQSIALMFEFSYNVAV